ncbi:MAG: cytochrome c [Myxococcota bacterium]
MSPRAIALSMSLAAVACFPDSGKSISPQARKDAQKVWKERCSTCHGLSGHGDGPQARYLEVKPRRLSDRAWKESVTDEHLRKVIVEGGPSVGLNLAMAPNPDLGSRPEVLEALIAHVRRL